MTQQQFDTAIKLIDAANSEDPNLETCDGKDWPKELLYSARMADMIERYDAEADEAPSWLSVPSTYNVGNLHAVITR